MDPQPRNRRRAFSLSRAAHRIIRFPAWLRYSIAVGSAPTGPVAFTPAPEAQVSGTWRGVFYEVASHRTSKVMEGQIVLKINDDGTFTETLTGQPGLTGKVTVKGNRVVLESSAGSRVTLMRSGNTLYGVTGQMASGGSVAVRLDRIEQGAQ